MRRIFRLGLILTTILMLWPSVALAKGTPPGSGTAPLAPVPGPTPLPVAAAEPKRIEVDISQQRLTAWEGDRRVRVFLVSTGDEEHPTVRGTYKIKAKYDKIDLIGKDYYYHDVPYVMMYSRPFYIHAAPWRTRFGVQGSRGCVTLTTEDAAWLYNWAPVGTVVVIHW